VKDSEVWRPHHFISFNDAFNVINILKPHLDSLRIQYDTIVFNMHKMVSGHIFQKQVNKNYKIACKNKIIKLMIVVTV